MSESISRRSFVTTAVTATAAAAACAGASTIARAEETAQWDAEADIVIVGCGGAGISAAITAADEGLGSTLLLEAAPEGYEGGNTRVSAQVIFCPTSVEGALKYQTNLNGLHKVEDKYLQAWAENLCANIDWLESQGIPCEQTAFFNPEWPDVEGSDSCMCWLAGNSGQMGFGLLWDALAARAADLGIEIQHDTRVTELVVEGGEVHGVRDEAGKTYKAKKGVILACGGFENDPDMVANYFQIGYSECKPMGTPYNRGDGIRMAQSVGADLWHMNNFANSGYGTLSAGEGDMKSVVITQWPLKDYIYVGPDGTRFMYEEKQGLARHGKYLTAGNATNAVQPAGTWCIFGSDTFNSDQCVFQQEYICQWNIQFGLAAHATNQEYLDAGQIVTGNTPEELAAAMGLDPDTLANTINSYNENAAKNEDPEYGRGGDVYSAFNYGAQGEAANEGKTEADEAGGGEMEPTIRGFNLVELKPPFYAVHLYTAVLNTQGGPRRDVDGGVLKFDGTTVPRLYAAGEMGTVYSYNYNGGGNVSEALSSGRLAARSAGALGSWE